MKKLNLFSILKKSNLNQEKLLFKFNNLSKNEVLIIGDFILDIYTECNALGKTSKTPRFSGGCPKVSPLGSTVLYTRECSTKGLYVCRMIVG